MVFNVQRLVFLVGFCEMFRKYLNVIFLQCPELSFCSFTLKTGTEVLTPNTDTKSNI